jgi:hypothetical protein
MTTARLASVVGLAALLAPACVKQYYPPTDKTGDGSPVAPSVIVVKHTVEFRALGTARAATLQYGSAQEGSTDLDTVIPWSSSFTTSRPTLFVYITGQPDQFGTLRVQIFLDGQLFREAETDGLGTAASASGTVQLSTTAAGIWHAVDRH